MTGLAKWCFPSTMRDWNHLHVPTDTEKAPIVALFNYKGIQNLSYTPKFYNVGTRKDQILQTRNKVC